MARLKHPLLLGEGRGEGVLDARCYFLCEPLQHGTCESDIFVCPTYLMHDLPQNHQSDGEVNKQPRDVYQRCHKWGGACRRIKS
jgi:hypothetical protein